MDEEDRRPSFCTAGQQLRPQPGRVHDFCNDSFEQGPISRKLSPAFGSSFLLSSTSHVSFRPVIPGCS